jgi:hypothetical protein
MNTKKRKKEVHDEVEVITKQRPVSDKPILVVLPGASGKLSKSMSDNLIQKLHDLFDIRVREGKWVGWNPSGNINMKSVTDLCPTDDTKPWYILGNSFGNRVICALCGSNKFVVPPTKIVMCGYPMYGENGTAERVTLLQSVPSTNQIMFISGENDEFLQRGSQLKGKALFESVRKDMLCSSNTTLHMISSAGHGVVDVPKSKLLHTCEVVFNHIVNYLQCT